MRTYKLMTLDVWGNETDGYEINNWYTWREEVPESEIDDIDLFIREHLIGSPDQYEANDQGDGFIEICHKETGEPILQLSANFEY